MSIRGKAWKFGDDIDTDIIIPARYLTTVDPAELAAHCMEPVNSDFPKRVKPGDVVVGGKNFGCGSSREHAPVALKGCGVAVVIAPTFARIFYRNAFNVGLPAIESAAAAAAILEGDDIEVDLAGGTIVNHSRGERYAFLAIPPFMMELVAAGGLMSWLKNDTKKGRG
jgi:3-isopropylmalate dehydrogenase/3-isopropylmalate/(R)-2-methylmalate dehydratase small subunit